MPARLSQQQKMRRSPSMSVHLLQRMMRRLVQLAWAWILRRSSATRHPNATRLGPMNPCNEQPVNDQAGASSRDIHGIFGVASQDMHWWIDTTHRTMDGNALHAFTAPVGRRFLRMQQLQTRTRLGLRK